MTPSFMLGMQQSHHSAAPTSKKHGGLLSRLFNSLSSEKRIESSSATFKPTAGSPWAPRCPPALPHQATAFSAASASTCTQSASQTGDTPCSQVPVLGYKMNIEEKYLIGRELGKGGNGVVRVVVNRETGEEFACKSIKKVLKDASEKKKQGHIESIRREVAALSKLQGSLNVVKLEDVFEDEDHVYIIMEMCKGGELWHRIGDRHYSERTVASFMRAVLRTLAQCHAQNIIHRDIKPGNFMLLSGDERAPVKAIDFGLAAPFDQQQLPRTDLGLEGTPWYMAPETLRGEWSPSSDMWAAGVMAFQLLSGRFPFDDKQNSFAPAITAIWRSVLNDPLDFSHPSWGGISAEARDFCKLLLNRDVAARPSAREALKHPWLKGDSSERSVGKKISRTVVARIQRFASGSLFRRSVLQYIAAELLSHPELLMASRMTSSSATAAAAVAAGAEAAAGGSGGGGGTVGEEEASVAKDTKVVAAAGSNDRVVAASELAALAGLLSQFRLDRTDSSLDERQLGEVLAKMGFRLAPSEVSRLMEGLDTDRSGSVGRSDLAACLVDWRHMQRNHTDLWLQLAARAFRHLDLDSSGVLEVDELIAAMRARLPPEEVAEALQEAMEEAAAQAAAGGCVYGGAAATAGVSTFGFGAASFGGGVMAGSSLADAQGLDFEAFVRLLKVGSHDSLDMYDDRMSVRSSGSRGGSLDRYNALLAASSHRRNAVLATSCSTAATDWSRHGPGGSRHGSGGGGGGSRHGDVSVHSYASDRSDVASMPDNDRSQHGSQYRHAMAVAAAPPPPGAISFRFDTDRTDRSVGGSKSTTVLSVSAATPAAAAAAAGSAAATNTNYGGGGGMVWRFDVGGPKAPPPPPPPVWRFDVSGGGSKGSWDHQVAAPSATSGGGGDRSGGGAGGTSLNGLHVRQQGGHFDRRMHGSNLYRNVALRALQGGGAGVGPHRGSCLLDTVAE